MGGAASAEPEGPPRRAAPVRRGSPGGRAGGDRRDCVRAARADAPTGSARVRGDPVAADGRGGSDRGGRVVRRVARAQCPDGDDQGGTRPRDPLPARHRCTWQRPAAARADRAARRAARAGGGHAADDDGHPLRGHRVAASRPRSAHPARPRGRARVLRGTRARPAGGRRVPRRPHRARQGRAHRPDQAARRLPLRRADGHGQDRAREGARRVPLRIGRAARSARHVRVPDARERSSACSSDTQHGVERGARLVSSVRKQPFSVVLLDEFEKAHANVWDVFLQVFDDGRLTDRQRTNGRLPSLRRRSSRRTSARRFRAPARRSASGAWRAASMRPASNARWRGTSAPSS